MVQRCVKSSTKGGYGLGLWLILALLCMPYGAGAQEPEPFKQRLWLGLHAGLNFSRYSFVPSVPQDMHRGEHAGLSLRYEIERGASAQIEVNYVRTGWTERFDTEGLAYSRTLSYVEIPLLTHLYLEKSTMRAFINLGPVIGLNLSDTGKAEGESASFTEAQLQRQTMPVANRVLWGLAGGPGVSLRLGERHRLEAEARILYSFSDIWSNRRSDPYGQSQELRIGATLSYFFRL